jgi:hypothetical protein
MKKTVQALREAADECERRARLASNRTVQAELFDLTAQWHWLAGEVARISEKAEESELV